MGIYAVICDETDSPQYYHFVEPTYIFYGHQQLFFIFIPYIHFPLKMVQALIGFYMNSNDSRSPAVSFLEICFREQCYIS